MLGTIAGKWPILLNENGCRQDSLKPKLAAATAAAELVMTGAPPAPWTTEWPDTMAAAATEAAIAEGLWAPVGTTIAEEEEEHGDGTTLMIGDPGAAAMLLIPPANDRSR